MAEAEARYRKIGNEQPVAEKKQPAKRRRTEQPEFAK
jgi:hypothetical protein